MKASNNWPTLPDAIESAQRMMLAMGYRLEQDTDGTVRMYRPDGSLAMTAKPPEAKTDAD